MLARDGLPVEEAARDLELALAGKVVYTDAPEFDERWCRKLFKAVGREMSFRFDESSRVIPDVPGLTFELVAEARRRAGREHRAANDVAYLVEYYRLAMAALERRREE